MKRLALLVLSALILIASVNAQEKKPKRPERVTYEQMTKKMTAELQLNEKQQEKEYDYDKKQEKYDKALCKFFTEEQYEGYKKLKPQFYSQRRIKEFLLQ